MLRCGGCNSLFAVTQRGLGFRLSVPTVGMERNVALARTVRDAVGSEIEIMFDAWMGWDATYTIRLLERIAAFHPRWMEEPVPPGRVDDFVRIRRRSSIPLATGEHEYTHWGFLRLLHADAVDVLQADPDWCGGISELAKICTLASAYGQQAVPHGHSIYAATVEARIALG